MVGVVQKWGTVVLTGLALFAALKIANQNTEIAELRLSVATEQAARERSAREHEAAIAKRERDHATEQQDQRDAHAKQVKELEDSQRTESAANKRLRDALAKATARANSGDSTDPIACGRAFDKLEELGLLVGEGTELLQEARSLLKERDIDIQRLWGQIKNDRKACGQVV